MTRHIPLTQNQVALVDDQDFEWLSQWNWYAEKNGKTWYAARFEGPWPIHKHVLMHRAILPSPDTVRVDHKDRNGLNNRRENLRLATLSQSMANRGMQRNNTSGFIGVMRLGNKFVARVGLNRKHINIGSFDSAIDAALARDAKAVELYGDFAVLNFPMK